MQGDNATNTWPGAKSSLKVQLVRLYLKRYCDLSLAFFFWSETVHCCQEVTETVLAVQRYVRQTSFIHKKLEMCETLKAIKQHGRSNSLFLSRTGVESLFVARSVWTICVGRLKSKQSVFCLHQGWGASGLTLSRTTLWGGLKKAWNSWN